MPRVVRIINRLNLGGPTFNAALLTKYMAPEFETILVAGTKTDTEESSEFICKELGIDFIRVPEMSRDISIRSDRIAYNKIKNIIQKVNPEIVHTHASKAGALGRMAAFSLKVPVVVHTFHGHVFHSYFNPIKSQIILRIERYLAKESSAIIAISEFQKNELVNKFHLCREKKVRVIPLGLDLSRFRQNQELKRAQFRKIYEIEDDEVVISIIGRLVPIKNHEMFLRALRLVLDRTTKKVRAFIIGDGELITPLRKMAVELAIVPLTFTSWIKDIDIAIAGSDIIALTSFNEGTPVSLIEAQAAGKPIVSTKVGGIENVVINNETALLCHSGDVDMFARHLLKLIENEDLRLSMSEKGWEQVGRKYHYERLVKDMKGLYYELLNKNQN